jgi:hypothetical protein
MAFDLQKLVSVSAAVEPVISTLGIDDDVAIRHFVPHPFVAEFRANEGVIMRNNLSDPHKSKDHLRMPSAPGQYEKYEIATLGARTQIIPAKCPMSAAKSKSGDHYRSMSPSDHKRSD